MAVDEEYGLVFPVDAGADVLLVDEKERSSVKEKVLGEGVGTSVVT